MSSSPSPTLGIYTNPAASTWTYTPTHQTDLTPAHAFHHLLPSYTPTPLLPLAHLATTLNIHHLFLKDESHRLGLPAFKILGASWATFRAICDLTHLPVATTSFNEIRQVAQEKGLTLFAATEGNHGRAVARMAGLLGVKARIHVPSTMVGETQERIREEGAVVTVVKGDYDAAVADCWRECGGWEGGLQIQDNAFEGYDVVPAYVVEGYATMLEEVEGELGRRGLKASVVVTPIGVGSLGDAVVQFCKSRGRGWKVVAVEPDTAGCLHESLKAGKMTSVKTEDTIMCGMNCATVSPMAWPRLRDGVDVSVTVSDGEAHRAVEELQRLGIDAGPCGAATLVGLRRAKEGAAETLGLDGESVVVLLCTEGCRTYQVPETG